MAYYMEGEFPTVVSGANGGGSAWGGDGIWAILLLALLGNGGFGFSGGRGAGAEALGYELGKVASTNDVASGFNNSAVLSGINDIKLANTQGFAGLNTVILQGFHGVDNAICNLGFNLTSQISNCCCDVKTMMLENRYLNEKQTCDIVNAINAGNQRLVDIYTTDKINALTAENVALKGRISNDAQSAYIINSLNPQARPAYIVPNPNCCYNACSGYGASTITGVL